jgi:hypothetical protein
MVLVLSSVEAHPLVCFFLGGIVSELAQFLLPVSLSPSLFIRISDTFFLYSTRPSRSVTRHALFVSHRRLRR